MAAEAPVLHRHQRGRQGGRQVAEAHRLPIQVALGRQHGAVGREQGDGRAAGGGGDAIHPWQVPTEEQQEGAEGEAAEDQPLDQPAQQGSAAGRRGGRAASGRGRRRGPHAATAAPRGRRGGARGRSGAGGMKGKLHQTAHPCSEHPILVRRSPGSVRVCAPPSSLRSHLGVFRTRHRHERRADGIVDHHANRDVWVGWVGMPKKVQPDPMPRISHRKLNRHRSASRSAARHRYDFAP